ncbi:MAG: hypothetical protein A2521_11000 [Deltaproteobacteria bacterium RIFOXYD12_FULL_57_12]|nr:MAG: hypothetical protein A2521_11000 [Deltaproteobacteria bacterium RIFOXYD12_FULL_57_12]
MHDPIKESRRWSAQAEDDLQFVDLIRKQEGYYDKVCFMAQQAGEKMLKACLFATGKRKVWGHSLAEMIFALSGLDPVFKHIDSPAKRLDRFYISARYPNGLPGLSPFQAYSKEDSEDAWKDLTDIFTVCREFLLKANERQKGENGV